MHPLVKATLIVAALIIALYGISILPGAASLILLLRVMVIGLALVAVILVFQNKL